MRPQSELRLIAVPRFPVVHAGDDLIGMLMECLTAGALALHEDDVVAFAQKIVSKAEGRKIDLATVAPSAEARQLAAEVQKDSRLVELILRESKRIVRKSKDVLIVEHRLGFIMANAGIDQSNVAESSSGEYALLLPEDPDRSAARLRDQIAERCGITAGVLISDSFGRPWRVGTVGVAVGLAGLAPTLDLRGQRDLFGRTLRVTVIGHADEIAAAASLLMGQSDEGCPVVIVRGLRTSGAHGAAAGLLRPSGEDLFR